MESKNLFAKNFKPRDYVISTRDRCDFTIDKIRSVRTQNYSYIKNYYNLPYMQAQYRDDKPYTKHIKKLYKTNKLNKVQRKFFNTYRPKEELYDIKKDPHQLVNLASNKKYQMVLTQLRNTLNSWEAKYDTNPPESKERLQEMYLRWQKKNKNYPHKRFNTLLKFINNSSDTIKNLSQ